MTPEFWWGVTTGIIIGTVCFITGYNMARTRADRASWQRFLDRQQYRRDTRRSYRSSRYRR